MSFQPLKDVNQPTSATVLYSHGHCPSAQVIDSISKKVDATLEYRDDVQIDRQVGKFKFSFYFCQKRHTKEKRFVGRPIFINTDYLLERAEYVQSHWPDQHTVVA